MDMLRKSFKYSPTSDTSANKSHHNLPGEDERLGLLVSQTNQENLKFSGNGKPNGMAESAGAPVGGDSSGPSDVIIKINPTRVEKETELSTSSSSSSPSPENQAQLAKNGNAGKNSMWRDSSYDFSNDAAMRAIANNNKDFDFGTESPPLSRIAESSPTNYGQVTPRDVRVSFNENNAPENVRRRSNASGGVRNGEPEEVLVCSGNASFKRKSSLLRTKTKSRLQDPPEQDQRSGRMGMKSGALGKASEIDEDDPFLEDDLPEEYKKMTFSPLTVLQLVSLILILAALVCSLTIRVLKRITVFDLELWRWELLVLVLICGRLVSGWGIRVVVFFIERNFLLRKRVLYFVYGLRNAVQNCVWLALVLIAWQFIFDKKVERMTKGRILPYVTRIWVCLLVGTLIWLVKTLLVKVLASSFHVSTFFDRIQESLFNQYVIETLSGPPLVEIQMEQEEEERVIAEVQNLQNAGAKLPADLKANVLKSGRVIGTPRKSPRSATAMSAAGRSPTFSTASAMLMNNKKEEEKGIPIDHLHRLNQQNISAWNMKRLMNIVRKGVLSTLDEKLHDSTAGEDESAVQITSENQAKIAAKKIFCNVAKRGSKYIYLEDLMRFMREDEALKTIRLFEGANEGKGISKRALKNWVVNAFRERRALALSLNDTKTAVNKLHQMLNVLVGILVVVIWLLILKVASTHFFIFLSSQVLLVVFMFGNTVKTTFEAIIFLFVMHPFDVGDRVEVEGVQMIVEEMNILTTVFLRFDNQKIIYPNSVLSTKPISNYYRSPDMGDAIDFCIHISTPMEKIALMKERITRYIENKSEHWYPAPMIVMRDVEDLNRLKWSIWLSHTMNHQDMGERWARRALLVEEMIRVFKDLDIEYRMLPLDVNVRNMPHSNSSRVPSNWSVFSG
ncbi:OLC1v1018316C1 [Oldenlandia corymbosa var. corymbosa]|uniref:Mechanosensitive ion channel protein n=1 Tax=Oldenlandia corymbosa var. corymbosa TaxID=529605 RepID=A0AAV1EBI3_OLDCO|nr:OLC1v1018316C1 [Oldenlandia corymbosa var. corymbosa]